MQSNKKGISAKIPAIVLLSVAAINISGAAAMAESKKADIRGKITAVNPSPNNPSLGSIRVEGKLEKDTNFDAASIRISATTRLEKLVSGKKLKAQFSDLKKGQKVESGFSGPVAESYPVQANGQWVLLLE